MHAKFASYRYARGAAIGGVCALVAALTAGATDASAQGRRGYASYSCGQLWHARNSIYAAQGYCFETPRAIATFGRGCFRPFGRLTAGQQARVDEIKYWEGRKGCGG